MKIINTGSPDLLQAIREEQLNQYLAQLLRKYGCLRAQNFLGQSFETKEELCYVIEESIVRIFPEDSTTKLLPLNDQFHTFMQLPPEIRYQIWELAFGLKQQRTVVHCVDERGGKFVSNQPISPALYVCHESRNLFLSRQNLTFAFGTYVDFNLDTIYLIDYEEKADKFRRFLESPSAHHIQKLAMRKSLVCEIPMLGHMSESQWEMKGLLKSWVELAVVFHDERDLETVWKDVGQRFIDLSARAKRRYAEISYARAYTKALNSMMTANGVAETRYRFVRVIE
ncbi:uncharacterized protein RCO7_08629 [Rhynchosporium graminicola]|uniref:2EXR domain-containing protein n=1 Tax=Rhynchosporium graminicola TaxID=2792576 RepID=A0A1E1JWG2_9HELO|nr:uncharacterized protein RCO7_08629 [Rhynchosporium commune]